jgi:hypothetical protein
VVHFEVTGDNENFLTPPIEDQINPTVSAAASCFRDLVSLSPIRLTDQKFKLGPGKATDGLDARLFIVKLTAIPLVHRRRKTGRKNHKCRHTSEKLPILSDPPQKRVCRRQCRKPHFNTDEHESSNRHARPSRDMHEKLVEVVHDAILFTSPCHRGILQSPTGEFNLEAMPVGCMLPH